MSDAPPCTVCRGLCAVPLPDGDVDACVVCARLAEVAWRAARDLPPLPRRFGEAPGPRRVARPRLRVVAA